MKKHKSDSAYALMLETYKTIGIDSIEKAYAEKANIKKKAWIFMAIIVVCLLLLSFVFTRFTVFWIMLALFVGIWVWMSAFYGFRFIDRYILEELG